MGRVIEFYDEDFYFASVEIRESVNPSTGGKGEGYYLERVGVEVRIWINQRHQSRIICDADYNAGVGGRAGGGKGGTVFRHDSINVLKGGRRGREKRANRSLPFNEMTFCPVNRNVTRSFVHDAKKPDTFNGAVLTLPPF